MGLGIPSIRIPSPRDVFNDTKDKVDDIADSGKRKVDRGRDFVTDRVDSGRGFVTDKINNGQDFVSDKIDNGRDFATDRIGDGRDFVSDRIDYGRDFARDRFDRGRDFVSDKLDNGQDFARDKFDSGREFVTEQIDSGRDYASDRFDDGRDFITEQVDSGTDIFGRAKDKAIGIANDVRDKATITPDDVHALDPGDSVSIDAKAEGGGGFIGGAEQAITVSRDDDELYTVSQEASAKAGVGVKDVGELGGKLGGAREFKFDNPDDAARAADILQKQTLASSPLAAPYIVEYIGSGDAIEDQKWLDQHTSKLEVGPGIYGKLGVPKTGLELDGLSKEFDPEGDGTGTLVGVEVELSGDSVTAVEYENGERKAIVETLDISLSGSLDADLLKTHGANPTPGVPTTDAELEQRIPWETNGWEADGVVGVQLEKRTSVETGEVEYSIKITTEGDVQDGRGRTIESTATIPQDKIDDVIKDLADGNVDAVVESVGLESESYETDIDRSGFDFGFVVGEVGAGKEYRDIDEDSRSTFMRG